MSFGRNTCESCPSLDIRVMHRQKKLWPTDSFIQSWARDGEEVGSINVGNERNRLLLSYRCQDMATETFRVSIGFGLGPLIGFQKGPL
jgi:hypothetical protein